MIEVFTNHTSPECTAEEIVGCKCPRSSGVLSQHLTYQASLHDRAPTFHVARTGVEVCAQEQ